VQTDTEGMPEYVTIHYASRLLGCSSSQIRRLIKDGVFDTHVVSKHMVEVKTGMPLKVTAIKLTDVLAYKEPKASAE